MAHGPSLGTQPTADPSGNWLRCAASHLLRKDDLFSNSPQTLHKHPFCNLQNIWSSSNCLIAFNWSLRRWNVSEEDKGKGWTGDSLYFLSISMLLVNLFYVYTNIYARNVVKFEQLTRFLINQYRPTLVRMIKSRRMRWAGHVACMGERRGVYSFDGETWRKESTWETQV
jgi:hypothetical protein